jgi:phosphoglycerol transferase MdoB-like AlkP superfamily enzyme
VFSHRNYAYKLRYQTLSFQCLLIASVSNYGRVKFNDTELPYGYELVAWIAMVGPLILIPLAAIYFYQYAKSNGKVSATKYSFSLFRIMSPLIGHTDEGRQYKLGLYVALFLS